MDEELMKMKRKASQLSAQLDWLEDELEKESNKSKNVKNILEAYYMKFWEVLEDRPGRNPGCARAAYVVRNDADQENTCIVGDAFTD
jgi:hypothetical protein